LKAPGYFDERALPYDAKVETVIRHGDLTALRELDGALARELMAGGWPALQVLAAACPASLTSTVLYADAPYGVGYLVATLWPDLPVG